MTRLQLALQRLAQGMPLDEVARRSGLDAQYLAALVQQRREAELAAWRRRADDQRDPTE